MEYRVILYHKQATSARTRFLKFAYESVCAPAPIPLPATLLERQAASAVHHPAAILLRTAQQLGLTADSLKAEGEYRQTVEVPGRQIQIILGEITTLDPPFDAAERIDACFIDLTQARGLPPVELTLLRYAYELVLGG